MARQLFLTTLALGAFALAAWVLIAALRADAVTGEVFFAIMPLLMLGGIAWNARARGPKP